MEGYPLVLALYDFVPVIFFLIGSLYLVRVAAEMCTVNCKRLAIAGSFLVFTGGFLKAVWKLLLTLAVGDFQLLSDSQFVLLAPGFLVLLVAVNRMVRGERIADERKPAVVLAMAAWKLPLLIVMTLASLGVQGLLTYTSFRRGEKLAATGFIVAFLSLLGMGAMASGEQTLAMQWIEQSINSAGQFGFMLGSLLLYRSVKLPSEGL